jgi:hypothetical protein
MPLHMWNTLLYICGVLRWFAHYFQITMTTLYASPFHLHSLRVLLVRAGWFVVFATTWVGGTKRVFR